MCRRHLSLSWLFIGFWEKFLFREVIQTQFAVLGTRLAMVTATVFFAIVHLSLGPRQASSVVFPIGLARGVAWNRVGMWPVAFAHATFEFVYDLFIRLSNGYMIILRMTRALTLLVAAIGLLRIGSGPSAAPGTRAAHCGVVGTKIENDIQATRDVASYCPRSLHEGLPEEGLPEEGLRQEGPAITGARSATRGLDHPRDHLTTLRRSSPYRRQAPRFHPTRRSGPCGCPS